MSKMTYLFSLRCIGKQSSLFASQNRMEMEHHDLYMNIALSDYAGMG